MTLLLVDNDRIFVQLLALLLEGVGYQTISACDGPTALRKVEQHAPALVLLDVALPRMSGFAVCQEIRRTSDVPIIFLSARSQAADRVRGLQLGADDYLVKPCDPDELLARVAAVLRRRRRAARSRSASATAISARLDIPYRNRAG